MRGRKIILPVMAVFLMLAALPAGVMGAPAVSAECAWTASDMACEVYVNSGADQLRSGGVLLAYNTGKLTNPVATKNGALWKFSAGATSYPYMNPETPPQFPAGQVVFIVGMLDTTNTNAGVSGARVKVGNVSFTRAGDLTNPAPGTSGTNQATFFGISAALGKGGNYVNFVNTAGNNLDAGATFAAIVAERGDANADGFVNITDVSEIRDMVFNVKPKKIYADCDVSNTVDISDVTCIRDKVFQPK